MEDVSYTCISEDVKKYLKAGETVEASVGNSQIVWNFQINLANESQKWLKGQITEKEVLNFADRNRMDSGTLE